MKSTIKAEDIPTILLMLGPGFTQQQVAGIITQRAIRRGSFSSVKELIAKIKQFVAAYNKTKAPFNWTPTADSILEKLQRLCSQISGTAH